MLRLVLLLAIWGCSSLVLASTSKAFLPVEPYVAPWCVKQFPNELASLTTLDMALLRDDHVRIEPFFGEWCLAQFPQYLSQEALDSKDDYLPIEDFMVHWAARSLAMLKQSTDGSGLADL